jgi:hypothetical protein
MTDNKQEQVQASAPASRYPESMRAIFAAFAHHGKPLRGLPSRPPSRADSDGCSALYLLPPTARPMPRAARP